MTLDERLRRAVHDIADDVSVPDVGIEVVRSSAQRSRRQTVVLAVTTVLVAMIVAGTAVLGGPDEGAPHPVEPVVPPTTTGLVPTTTQRVYLAAQPWSACQSVAETFTPLKVSGPGYTATVEPTKVCRVLEVTGGVSMNYFVYDVPMPETGKVTVTPGNQPAASLDASKVATKAGRRGTHGVTVVFTKEDFGVYALSFIWRGNTREETVRSQRAARAWLKQQRMNE